MTKEQKKTLEQIRVDRLAEQTAKDLAKILAKILYEQITDEADVIGVDKKWYFENVVHYMTAESEVKNDTR